MCCPAVWSLGWSRLQSWGVGAGMGCRAGLHLPVAHGTWQSLDSTGQGSLYLVTEVFRVGSTAPLLWHQATALPD